MLNMPAFTEKQFVTDHIKSILAFYDAKVDDESGGYFQNYKDDGSIFNPEFKQLVSSTRIVVNYAVAFKLFGKEEYKARAVRGIRFVEDIHWQPEQNAYAWTLHNNQAQDMTQQAYGYAFVLLAYAALHKYQILDCRDNMQTVFAQLETSFWQTDYGLYADEISADGVLSDYRGQNANMHLCEAMLMAYEASGDIQYLDKAETIANNICFRQAELTNGLVWEHYTKTFLPDWEYNKDDPKNLYRPWGFQPGHQTEWTKLLLSLHRHRPSAKYENKAIELFDIAYGTAWDNEYGGLVYGFSPDGKWCDEDKYFWVQAESIAAAAMIYELTGNNDYLDAYQALWAYCWKHMIDHEYGAWFRLLTRENGKTSDEKSSAGAKCDYHSLCACAEVLRVIGDNEKLSPFAK
ncbi:AGE family epimerase/isomerase [Agaribacter marinus]|uniref:N-acylglucosamine 2-epimerase n=1 Tax=Agaribacter marinus TaxID=1431249 RepID=A0AA37SYA5_9ALTE|nr:AGE family epimerase/isomerase [Agaribacter marinus]GLR70410.1 N-acylglucosamine 2-epimerase [Agaribacter marinus]